MQGGSHHHPAAGQEPVPDAGAHAPPQDPGGAAGGVAGDELLQGPDPRPPISTGSISAPAPTASTPRRGAYFGVPATEVNLEQAAMLAGLLKAPSRYAPDRDPERGAAARPTSCSSAMVDAGFITDKDAAGTPTTSRRCRRAGRAAARAAATSPIGSPTRCRISSAPRPRRCGSRPRWSRRCSARPRRIVDAAWRRMAARSAPARRRWWRCAPDGAVVAMVGGRGYSQSQFNRAVTAQRQPGSSFKTFVYLAAVEQGLTPDSLVLDAPITIGNWSPGNYDGKFHGEVTAREALANSLQHRRGAHAAARRHRPDRSSWPAGSASPRRCGRSCRWRSAPARSTCWS